MSKDYVKIGTLFEQALEAEPLALPFSRAIGLMQTNPELVARIPAWDDMLWLCIEEYLNGLPTQDTDKNELFIMACALLDG